MQKRKLGYSDLELTVIGLGTWAIGGSGWEFSWGPQDENQAVAGILAGLDEGINWIDTAAVYGLGRSEELVGKALKQTREKPIVATKCSLTWDDNRQIHRCLEAKSIRRECEASLKRLGVDVIDLYQIHWPQSDRENEQAWEEMAKLAEEQKIRYLGASNFTVDQIKRVQKIYPVASLQPAYSMLHREVEDELLDFCTENDIGVIAYSPMQRGLLTGKFSNERLAALDEEDQRRRAPDFQEPQFSATLEFVDKLREIADRSNRTLAQLAISWVLRRSDVTAAIVGVRRPEQIAETAKAADWTLDEQDIEQIDRLLANRLEKVTTG